MLGDLFLWQADAHEQFVMHTFSSVKELWGEGFTDWKLSSQSGNVNQPWLKHT